MKLLFLTLALSLPLSATFETWTNQEGKPAKLDFVK